MCTLFFVCECAGRWVSMRCCHRHETRTLAKLWRHIPVALRRRRRDMWCILSVVQSYKWHTYTCTCRNRHARTQREEDCVCVCVVVCVRVEIAREGACVFVCVRACVCVVATAATADAQGSADLRERKLVHGVEHLGDAEVAQLDSVVACPQNSQASAEEAKLGLVSGKQRPLSPSHHLPRSTVDIPHRPPLPPKPRHRPQAHPPWLRKMLALLISR
jgi:hypothetical protein